MSVYAETDVAILTAELERAKATADHIVAEHWEANAAPYAAALAVVCRAVADALAALEEAKPCA